MHGSITKSGKVKKSTPIVEPKDVLFKKPVGRAKKRVQYQKRIVFLSSIGENSKIHFKPNKQMVI